MGIVFLLIHAGNRLERVQSMERLGVYELQTSVEAREAERILEEERKETEAYCHRLVFFAEQKEEIVENTQWYRQTEADVVKLCGDSTLLFPYGYPLEPEDTKGCLIGEETAVALFGGRQVIGERIGYGGEQYEIRGILPDENLLVLQAQGETAVCYAGVLGDTPAQREKAAGLLQNAYGLDLREVPFRFYEAVCRAQIAALCMLAYSGAGVCLLRVLSGRGKEEEPEGKGAGRGRHGGKAWKKVRTAVAVGGAALVAAGMIYILSYHAYAMPDKISDLSGWGGYFGGEWTEWKRFLSREEIFLHRAYW